MSPALYCKLGKIIVSCITVYCPLTSVKTKANFSSLGDSYAALKHLWKGNSFITKKAKSNLFPEW